ncbi:class I adenylate-forming enzyme family protein [Caballeronia cordobensis]|uniref:class I adenylate-forming enzyme family protein n=1 Tax=Caballeronia cordobensis TaxID=1353886 RepID=UPI0006AD71D8|nr:class I adenylate-forming enzyme family protein [Caballeronia cordobensis]
MLLIDYFEQVATGSDKDRPFLHFIADDPASDRMLTYEDADRACSRYARALIACGVSRGHCIAMLQPNSVEWVLWYFAAQKIGAITCALNTDFKRESLADIVRGARAKVIIADSDHAELALALKSECPLIDKVLAPESAEGVDAIARFTDAYEATHLSRAKALDAEDITAIILSSGTTGNRPKAIRLSNRALIKGNGAYLSAVPVSATDKVLIVTPIFHSCTLAWAITASVMRGATIVLAARFSSSRFWEQADRSRASILWTMGTIIHILLKLPRTPNEAAVASRIGWIFAAGMGKRVLDAKARWPAVHFVDGYGLTESAGTIATDDSFTRADPFVCVGRPAPGIDLRIVDVASGNDVATRQHGEILLRYGQGFSGYLDNDDAMRESVRDGWFHTGDVGYRDEEGRFYFVDRMKDVIRCGGKNIAASEIEHAYASHPEISEVLALPAPDDVYGEQVAVVVVPKNPLRRFGIDEMQAYGRSRLAAFKLPQIVLHVVMEDLPRTPTGKVSKAALKRMLLTKTEA